SNFYRIDPDLSIPVVGAAAGVSVIIKAHPTGFGGDDGRVSRLQMLALDDGRDPQQRQTKVFAARPHLADLASVGRYDRSRGRDGAVDLDGHEPLLDQAPVLGACRQLLADIAALLPVDAV